MTINTLSAVERKKILQSAIANINKKHPGVILDPNNIPTLDIIPTGSYKLDNILGIAGIPRSKMIEIFGEKIFNYFCKV